MKEPSKPTIKRLFALSGNICAFPSCQTPLIEDSGTVTGKICHIKAKNKNGPRYDKNQTNEERHSFENLILLCGRHHDIIDKEEKIYSVEVLEEIKEIHIKHIGRAEKDEDNIFATILLNDYRELYINNTKKQIITNSSNTTAVQADTIDTLNIRSNRDKITINPPNDSIGQNIKLASYIEYLIKRYNKYASKEPSRKTKFSFGALSRTIESKFGAHWKMVPSNRHEELSNYILERISKTRIAKYNKSKGKRYVSTFEEYLKKHFN